MKDDPKEYGGDYFWIWIYNVDLRASAAADEIIDHQNGTYSARFKLHWSGKVKIAVNLVHSSEAVSVLTRLRDNNPARSSYEGKFQYKDITRLTSCHITQSVYYATDAKRLFCNFTDEKTGFPWFCVKPVDIGCDRPTYVYHRIAPDGGSELRKNWLSEDENKLFSS